MNCLYCGTYVYTQTAGILMFECGEVYDSITKLWADTCCTEGGWM